MFKLGLGSKTVEALAFAPAGGALFAAAGRVLFRLEWPGGRVTHSSYHIPRSDRPYFGDWLVAGADGWVVVGQQSNRYQFWQGITGNRLDPIEPAVCLPTYCVPVAGTDPLAVIVNICEGKTPSEFRCRTELVATDGSFLVELPHRYSVVKAWQEPDGKVLVLDADGLRLISGPKDKSLRSIWRRTCARLGLTDESDVLAATEYRGFPAPGFGSIPVARHPSGQSMFFGDGGAVVEWDRVTASERRRWRMPLDRIHSLAVSPDGLTVAAGGWHGTVVGFDLD